MLDVSRVAVALYGALAALVIFGVFIGTWWYYGIRAHRALRLWESGRASLVELDTKLIDGARPIALEDLDAHIEALRAAKRPIVLTSQDPSRGKLAAKRLRGLGFRVYDVGSSFATHPA